jgi:hypothetical protein
MRAAFGLVGLLAAAGVVIMIFAKGGGDYVGTVARTGQQATEQARQLGGQSTDGQMRFNESLTMDASIAGGKTVGLIVLSVNPAGPAATFYGLMPDDIITAIGPLEIKGGTITGADDGMDFLMDAYSRQQPITVVRGEKTITLPGGAPPAVATPQQQPPPPPKDDRGSLQRQLDNITGAGQKPPGGN